jgi:alpha-tubulin suppressor-like RCC1 family protein
MVASVIGSGAFAIREDRTLWSWGSNVLGMIGQGATASLSSPVQIGSSSWSFVSGGYLGGFAIDINGGLWATGYNDNGNLGLGDRVQRTTFTKVGSSSWSFISAYNSTAGITSNGRLFTWGENGAFGPLGQGNTIRRSSPVQVGASSWSQVSVGYYNMIGLDLNKRLFGWGYNNYGQVGDGTTNNRTSPVLIGNSSWIMVTADNDTSAGAMAIKLGGTLWGWGEGTGDLFVTRSSPTQVGTAAVWTSINKYSASSTRAGLTSATLP